MFWHTYSTALLKHAALLLPSLHPPDVHSFLGEVAMESDNFEAALAELDASLAHLTTFVQVRFLVG